ncbi:hypothetical protein [Streptomyces sp. NPDC058457]|uniref:hypothetical protein n=1 Tax=Streptomyces sp. NPDC058457 TaxID=3346507 RepID=UPI00365C5BAB
MIPRDHFVYGSDWGVPCTDEASVARNVEFLHNSSVLTASEVKALGHRVLELVPRAAARLR